MRLLVFFISLIFLLPQQGGKHRLVVTVTGLKPLKGDLYISLHQRPEYFQFADSALMKTKIGVNAETETVFFDKVPEGRYAIAIYHDENLNGMMDANEIGIPREGYGFSNNPKVPGKPKFEQAAFDLSRNDTIVIKMIYHPAPNQRKDSENK
ncbi:MAG: DUF2141 domain-containing protein [Bacteroidales bacterium]|nr:DUF2141 domain-containing protein [Bacteroidales bacterium]